MEPGVKPERLVDNTIQMLQSCQISGQVIPKLCSGQMLNFSTEHINMLRLLNKESEDICQCSRCGITGTP